jgi:heat shock protein HtpX
MSQRIRREKAKNFWRTVFLFSGMMALLLAVGYLLMGLEGLFWIGALGALGLYLSAYIPVQVIMRMYRARPLAPAEAPQLARVVEALARRANLSLTPRLYYISNRALNAFAAGSPRQPAIALTHGMLSQLSLRELSAVIAHEISHIGNNDMRLQRLLMVMGRMTRLLSMMGIFIILLNVTHLESMPWAAVLLLLAAPWLSMLLKSAISRTREFDADLEAARLTGDPNALADALAKLSYLNGGSFVERMIPKSLSTHPRTRERIHRLRELAPRFQPLFDFPPAQFTSLEDPFFRRGGFWMG